MLNFQVKSPGKIILHGEHAVVYHKPALAAVVGVGTTLKFENAAEDNKISFKLEALNTTFEIDIGKFNNFLKHCRTKFPECKLENAVQLLEEVRLELAKQQDDVVDLGSPKKQQTQKAFISIYYLLAGAILSSPVKDLELQQPFTITIDTELNIGAGLGSSASYGVALASAFLVYAQHFDLTNYKEEENQQLISAWGFESERVMHGTPSGIDNTVCTYGGMLRFVKGQGFQTVKILRPLHILLVDSKVKRATADIVAKVRHLGETFPEVINAIWNACEALVNTAIPIYENFGTCQDDSEKFEKLEHLFQINNDLLKAIGVTHPKLEQIFSIAFKRGFFSKITGAGAGGYAIVLLPENYASNEVYWKLKEELEGAGFGVHATTAGGEGLLMEPL
ncbi:mevalonate kinase [Musca autumnalis]|uniref:mevalonate kinase n=1 Tax=Musca autumnalis TaxID=221902 RepID=UPI003CF5D3A3